MAKKFEYKKRSYDEAKKQVNESDSGLRDGYLLPELQLFKPAEGTNKVRIMPPGWDEADHYGYRIAVHYSIGPNNDAYICPFHTVNPVTGLTKQPCPICEERNRVLDSDEDYAKKLKPSQRVLVYLLERGGKNAKPTLKAWAMPTSLDKEILKQAIDDETREVIPVDDPEDGYDLDIIREGTGLTTKYSIKVARRSSEVEDFEEDIWPLISGPKALDRALIFYDYDYLAAAFSGTGTPAKTKTSKKKSKIDVSELEYADVLDFTEDELHSIIEQENLDIDPDDADNADELAEMVAKELGLRPPKRKTVESDDSPKSSDRKPLGRKKEEPEEEPAEDADEYEEPLDEPSDEPAKPSSRDRLANLRNRNK